ncbi:MAG: hypothetical protein HOQ10_09515 [Frateuria sp.]|nr:hypothetical protein [Frateuria sp.]
MTGEGVPKLPASLDCSDEAPAAYGLLQALEHAYYEHDIDSLRRIALQAEQNMAALRDRVAELTRAGPAERLREVSIRGVASACGSPPV